MSEAIYPFRDRIEAGRLLAEQLREYANRPDVVVLALPRDGVPVGFEVARALQVPLDVFIVRKLGVPGHEEVAMGAIASGGIRVLNSDIVVGLGIPEERIDRVAEREARELERREREYRDNLPPVDVRGRTVVPVDDGLATGSSMRVAALALKKKQPAQIIVAVPVAPPHACAEFESVVDKVVCAVTPEPFGQSANGTKTFRRPPMRKCATCSDELRAFNAQKALSQTKERVPSRPRPSRPTSIRQRQSD